MSQFCNSQRLSDGVFIRPSATKSLVNCAACNAVTSTPVRETQRFAVECDEMVPLLITSLFSIGGPTTVFRVITFVIVDAFNRVRRRRFFSYIGQEVQKAVFTRPSFSNSNAQFLIAFIAIMFRVCGSLNQLVPRGVSGGFRISVTPILTFDYTTITRHVHAPVVNVLTRALGLFAQPQGSLIITQ